MSMDICITLSDADIKLFVDSIRNAEKKADELDAVSIVGAAVAKAVAGASPAPPEVGGRCSDCDRAKGAVS